MYSQPQVTGQWQTLPFTLPLNPIHVMLLHTNKILVVAGSENDPHEHDEGISKAAVVDLNVGNVTLFGNLPWDLFCNGMAALPDGRAIIVGGSERYDPFYGGKEVTVFDPVTSLFSQVQDMAHGRWYATSTTLSDGRVLAFSGTNETGATNNAVEIYKAATGWSSEYVAPFAPPLYPHLFLLPDGNVFFTGTGWSIAAVPNTSNLFRTGTQTWTMSGARTVYGGNRESGTAVLLPLLPERNYAPRVMILGGANPAIASTEIIDLSAATPTWTSSGNMRAARRNMDAVLLPNGRVFAEGGSSRDQPDPASLAADLFDPANGTWSSAGTAAYSRLYHSVALLLPDGRVWVAGSNPVRGSYEQHMELWSPPYLFTTDGSGATIPAKRPSITSTPPAVGYGGMFQVDTPDAADIKSAVLIRPGSSSHGFDFDQRLVGLTFTRGAGALTVTGPPDSKIAPPGYYMLFLLNNAGVPSMASFIRVSPDPTNAAPKGSISSPGNVTIQAGSSVSFAGSGTDSDGTIAKYSWIFPGGSPESATVQNPGAVTFSSPGTYIASLTVVDNNDANDPSPPVRTITVLSRPALTITKTHAGSFTQGQKNATYTISVSNAGQSPTSGTVTVNETLPAGLTLVSMAGTGWNCPTEPTVRAAMHWEEAVGIQT
jgi:uncharacterized repeat protein (TIGR01451 family)